MRLQPRTICGASPHLCSELAKQSLLCPAGAGPGGLNAWSGEQNPATGSGLNEVGVIPQGARQWALNFDPVFPVPQLPQFTGICAGWSNIEEVESNPDECCLVNWFILSPVFLLLKTESLKFLRTL